MASTMQYSEEIDNELQMDDPYIKEILPTEENDKYDIVPSKYKNESNKNKARWKWNFDKYENNMEYLFDPLNEEILLKRGKYNLNYRYRKSKNPVDWVNYDDNELIKFYNNLSDVNKFRFVIDYNPKAPISSKLAVRQFITDAILHGKTGIFVSDRLDVMLEMYFDVCSILYIYGHFGKSVEYPAYRKIRQTMVRYYKYSPDITNLISDICELPTIPWIFTTTDKLFIDATNLLSLFGKVNKETNEVVTKKRDILIGLNVDTNKIYQTYRADTIKTIIPELTKELAICKDNGKSSRKLLSLYRQVKSNVDIIGGIDVAAPTSYYNDSISPYLDKLLLLSASNCLDKLNEFLTDYKPYRLSWNEKGDTTAYKYYFMELMPFAFERIFDFYDGPFAHENNTVPDHSRWYFSRFYYDKGSRKDANSKKSKSASEPSKPTPKVTSTNPSDMLMDKLLGL